MSLRNRIALGAALAMALCGAAFGQEAGDSGDWPFAITAEHRPGTYWWCPGSAFDKESIDWNLENLHAGGIGTVHIVPIYGAKGYEDRYIDYLSPEWMAMLDYIVKKADSLGMLVDMTTGTGWCFGGPGLDEDMRDTVVERDKDTGALSFVLGRNVKRAAPGGAGPMLNPYSPDAMRFYLERFTRAFDESKAVLPRAQYHDSFEYRGNWSTALLDEFKQRRGYDLSEHLDVFFAEDGDAGTRARLKYDYRLTLDELHYECIALWAEWARERGMATRNQAHGGPGNILDTYALTDEPETEMFGAPEFPIPGFRRDPDATRPPDDDPRVSMMASSAAHVAHEPGRQRVGSETCTWMRNHWHGTLGQAKLELDLFFLTGVNHIYYHGSCYSAKDAPWPGWFFYASTKFDWRNSIWRDMPLLNMYAARCQSVLQAGVPDNDVLVYWPIHDEWMNADKLAMLHTVHYREWLTEMPIGAVAQQLLDKGYAFDFVSDRMMETLETRGDGIKAPGGEYHVIVVPACTHMPLATARRLATLAEEGASVVFEKTLPSDVPGFADLAARREALAKECARLGEAGVKTADDVCGALADQGVRRETLVDSGLRFIRRKVDGDTYYFIANHGADAWDGFLPLATPFKAAAGYDPMTGRSGALDKQAAQVRVQIEPGESLIVRAYGTSTAVSEWKYIEPADNAVTLTNPWKVEFIQGGPALPDAYETPALASWTNAPDERAEAFAGTARYTATFILPVDTATREWLLDLGDVRESARVRVNGKDAGAVFALPFRLRVEGLITPGENTIEIEVTNLAANRIRNLDRSGADWKIMHDINIVNVFYRKFEPAKWDLVESGLLGPVTLTPLK